MLSAISSLSTLSAMPTPAFTKAAPTEAPTASATLPSATSIEIGSSARRSPLVNYGLPREVLIARRSDVAMSVDLLGADTAPWSLSIASRFIGDYASQTKAASAASRYIA